MLTSKPCRMVNATPDKYPTYIVALVAQLIYDQCFRPNDFIVWVFSVNNILGGGLIRGSEFFASDLSLLLLSHPFMLWQTPNLFFARARSLCSYVQIFTFTSKSASDQRGGCWTSDLFPPRAALASFMADNFLLYKCYSWSPRLILKGAFSWLNRDKKL